MAGRAGSTVPTWTFWIFSFDGGQICRQRRTTTSREMADRLRPYAIPAMGLPVCARPAAEPAPADDDVARRFWDVRVLPSPALRVVPDYALTGKPVYLQIGGDRERRFEVDNPLGADVVITATSRYVVEWGDRATTSTVSQGGPWPNGDVTHTYTHMAPEVTISVTQVWEATWSAGDASGTLEGLRTTSSLSLPVRQLQAVRNV
ncbi:MAG: hypothetical protein ACRD0N_13890 [Acidimicrobiales bacterium]